MDEMVNRWKDLSITVEEEEVAGLNDADVEACRAEVNASLLGRLATKKHFNRKAFKDMIEYLWDVEGKLDISEIQKGIFLFSFEKESERDRVLASEPWFFNKSLLVLKAYEGDRSVDAVDLQFTDFWIQIHSLPIDGRNYRTAKAVGDVVGICRDVDKRPSGSCMGIFLRARVSIDISKPLRRGTRVRLGSTGPLVWADLKYERLPDFCHGCGKIGHTLKECISVPQDVKYGKVEAMYGDWLRARGPEKTFSRRRNGWGGGSSSGRSSSSNWNRENRAPSAAQTQRQTKVLAGILNSMTPPSTSVENIKRSAAIVTSQLAETEQAMGPQPHPSAESRCFGEGVKANTPTILKIPQLAGMECNECTAPCCAFPKGTPPGIHLSEGPTNKEFFLVKINTHEPKKGVHLRTVSNECSAPSPCFIKNVTNSSGTDMSHGPTKEKHSLVECNIHGATTDKMNHAECNNHAEEHIREQTSATSFQSHNLTLENPSSGNNGLSAFKDTSPISVEKPSLPGGSEPPELHQPFHAAPSIFAAAKDRISSLPPPVCAGFPTSQPIIPTPQSKNWKRRARQVGSSSENIPPVLQKAQKKRKALAKSGDSGKGKKARAILAECTNGMLLAEVAEQPRHHQ